MVECSVTNGGFYPPTIAAEFHYRYYPSSLRRYERPPNYIARCASASRVRESLSKLNTLKAENNPYESGVILKKKLQESKYLIKLIITE